MGFKREDIRDTSPLSLKKLNDTLRYLWLHSFGNITFSDLNSDLKGNINSRVTKTEYDAKISEIQNQIDGVQYSWFYPYVPTLANYPASDWTTNILKNDHIGDTFTDTTVDGSGNSTGYSYRFINDSGTYKWSRIADSTAAEALQKASKAQDTADSKRRVFTITPFVPYDIGDMWLQGSTGDILKCKTAKDENGVYSSADWEFASKYTDDEYAKAVEQALGTRVTTVEQKVTDNALVTTVTSSTTYRNDLDSKASQSGLSSLTTRVSSAEQKITDSAIISTVTSSITYQNDMGSKITASQASTIAQSPTNVQVGFNGISNTIVMDSTGLKVNHTDGSYSKLEATGLKKYTSGTGKTYHYLTYVGSAVVPSTNDVITIQLPDEWKGKEFYATASLSAVNNWTTGYAMQTFAAFVESYDRPNGRFTIHGGMEVFHVSNPSGTHAKIDSQVSFTVVA